jgi:hypothetical protein
MTHSRDLGDLPRSAYLTWAASNKVQAQASSSFLKLFGAGAYIHNPRATHTTLDAAYLCRALQLRTEAESGVRPLPVDTGKGTST